MTKRIEKVNSLLQHEIGSIIQKENIIPDGSMATITKVDASANLIEAKIYVSIFPEIKADAVMNALKGEVFSIQKTLNRKLNMRPVPKIIFIEDRISSQVDKVEAILHQLKKDEK